MKSKALDLCLFHLLDIYKSASNIKCKEMHNDNMLKNLQSYLSEVDCFAGI